MKRILIILITLISLISCQSHIDLGSISLGEQSDEVIQTLKEEGITFSYIDNSEAIGEGKVILLGINWNKVLCKFDNNILVEIAMIKPFSQISDSQIENIKSYLRKYCGPGKTNYDEMMVLYGVNSENKGYIGAIKVNEDEDNFFVSIKKAK